MSNKEERAVQPATGTSQFGTDGVRGVAGSELTPELAASIARAATRTLRHEGTKVLIIRDTRGSGEMLGAAVAAGVMAAGAMAVFAGELPTPAAPLLVCRYGFSLAIVITASHNPHTDNGIKLFGRDGFKLSRERENEIASELGVVGPAPARFGVARVVNDGDSDYLDALKARFATVKLSGMSVVLDCANGVTSSLAPAIFRERGAQVDVLADDPDGLNINAGCGATDLRQIRERMCAGDLDVGFAFDGGGERVTAIDRHGEVVDGDDLVALLAPHLKAAGRLRGDGVAVTVISNLGLDNALREAGIEVARTPVGDRHVVEELVRRRWGFGGEQSGHIVTLDPDGPPSVDGIAAALLTLEALGGRDLSDRERLRKLPERRVNVPVRDRASLAAVMRDPGVVMAIGQERPGLINRGQINVRASGTEPAIRVVVQAPGETETARVCATLVRAVQQAADRST